MSTRDTSQSPQGDASSAHAASAALNVLPPAASRAASGPGKLAAAAGLAALVVWSVMLVVGYPFFPGPQTAPTGGAGPPMPNEEERAAMIRCASLSLATLMAISGGLLGVGMALAEGARNRPAARVLLAVFASAVAGACAGIAAAWCGERMFLLPGLLMLDRMTPGTSDVIIQGACWSLVGFGVAAGLTLSACRRPQSLLGGALGGLFSALLYSIISAVVGILVPANEVAGLVPNSTANRLLWLITAAVCIGAGIGITGQGRRSNTQG